MSPERSREHRPIRSTRPSLRLDEPDVQCRVALVSGVRVRPLPPHGGLSCPSPTTFPHPSFLHRCHRQCLHGNNGHLPRTTLMTSLQKC